MSVLAIEYSGNKRKEQAGLYLSDLSYYEIIYLTSYNRG